jgi:hypothetical protein
MIELVVFRMNFDGPDAKNATLLLNLAPKLV